MLLNRLTGLGDLIDVHIGSALDLPFPDGSFDVAWMQNVGMNIADKQRLYAEIHRVLKSGARFAFQEIAAGKSSTTYYPLPWQPTRWTITSLRLTGCRRFSAKADSSLKYWKTP